MPCSFVIAFLHTLGQGGDFRRVWEEPHMEAFFTMVI